MEQLGIEPIQLATQVFNFVIMALVLTRFLYKPILKALKDRRDKIAEGLSYAEKTKAEFEKTETARHKVILAAKEEGQRIVEESKKAGKLMEAEIIEKSHEEARAIVEKGKADVEMERADMEKKLKEQMVDVAEAIALKALESSLTITQHRAIIDKKIRVLAKQLS